MGISSPPSGIGDGLGVILATVPVSDPGVLRVNNNNNKTNVYTG